ncbi:hypothetical protein [Metabacillus niabensis]|uniref:Type IV secretory pathway TrbL component n=1 Tax=Metabacillus niabensis TaxID=324854 RepID=A0ABT9Z2E3_9BACI|nr:hypothetical protein [Metabacillus niabensis]MDQ0226426.1 type IV secretory pathway TrbL component [Metabacillus niabensis]PAD68943.1 hypothetical protein CHH83_11295 [Bacillus sp. 7586-K]
MKYYSSFITAVLLTSLSYFLGDIFLTKGLSIWHAIIIGACVVTLGAVVEKLNSPMWLIILTPFPVGMGLLFLFLNESFMQWFITYALTLLIYVVIHVVASRLFRFHSLIPAWKLSKS